MRALFLAMTHEVERDIFAGIPREWSLDSVQSRGTVGNGFHADGNGRERLAWIRRLSIRTRNVNNSA